MKRVTAARLARVIARYLRRPGNGAGGNLHIVLDNGNTKRADLHFCERWASDRGDWSGARLARLMATATPTQWTKAIKLARGVKWE